MSFKAHPDIKIKFLQDNATTFNAMVAAGNTPDLSRSHGIGSISQVAKGIYENLDPYVAKSSVIKASDLNAVNNLFRWDGKVQGSGSLYGLVKDWSMDTTLWYNKTALKAAGLTGPGENESLSFDEMLTMAKKLTIKKNGQFVQYGLDIAWGWTMEYLWLAIMAQAGGSPIFSADGKTANFTSPAALKAMQWFVDYLKAQVGPSPIVIDANSPTTPFTANRTALDLVGYWFGEQVQATSAHFADHIGYAPSPHWEGKRFSGVDGGVGMSIASTSKVKDAAWKVMEWFMGGQPAIDRASTGWGLPALNSLMHLLPQQTAFDKLRLRVTKNDSKFYEVVPLSPYADYTGASNAVSNELVKVAKGSESLTTAAKNIQNAVTKLIKEQLSLM
jgi:multiple sugar transport system substrate-binding protein